MLQNIRQWIDHVNAGSRDRRPPLFDIFRTENDATQAPVTWDVPLGFVLCVRNVSYLSAAWEKWTIMYRFLPYYLALRVCFWILRRNVCQRGLFPPTSSAWEREGTPDREQKAAGWKNLLPCTRLVQWCLTAFSVNKKGLPWSRPIERMILKE